MKTNLITALVLTALVAGPTLASVWVKTASGGDAGKACHLITFNTASYGQQMLMGNGVVSGSTYTGFLRFSPNPQYNGITSHRSCVDSGDCAWNFAFNYYSNSGGYVVSVSGLPITSAQAVACY